MTTTTPAPADPRTALVYPFPTVGRLMQLAYRELELAVNGTTAQIRALGDLSQLPRPWDPATCTTRELREEVWYWLDSVVTWLNQEYVWDVTDMIPSCWPHHPHLVHELAVLADQRLTASRSLTSDRLEDWHRYSLPQFTDRLRSRSKNHCDNAHQPWPARGRHARHLSHTSKRDRNDLFDADETSLPTVCRVTTGLGVVDLDTGEIEER